MKFLSEFLCMYLGGTGGHRRRAKPKGCHVQGEPNPALSVVRFWAGGISAISPATVRTYTAKWVF